MEKQMYGQSIQVCTAEPSFFHLTMAAACFQIGKNVNQSAKFVRRWRVPTDGETNVWPIDPGLHGRAFLLSPDHGGGVLSDRKECESIREVGTPMARSHRWRNKCMANRSRSARPSLPSFT